MRRRELILGLGAAIAAATTVRAQQNSATPIIGFLSSRSPYAEAIPGASFRQALEQLGYIEGRNVTFEHRWAEGYYDRLPGIAIDLVQRPVTMLVSLDLPSALAAKAATTTTPVIFWTGGDPVTDGLVPNLNRPGGNLTGVGMFNNVLGAKRLELLRELVPNAAVFALLINPANPNAPPQIKDAQEAAQAKGLEVQVITASADGEIDAAFARLGELRADALLVAADPFLATRRERVISLASRYSIPAIYTIRLYAKAGGLISYTSSASMDSELGSYTGRILKGERPGDLPIIRPSKFQLVINLKTAKALGLTVPPILLAQADEVIE